jgi:hypothetical protein
MNSGIESVPLAERLEPLVESLIACHLAMERRWTTGNMGIIKAFARRHLTLLVLPLIFLEAVRDSRTKELPGQGTESERRVFAGAYVARVGGSESEALAALDLMLLELPGRMTLDGAPDGPAQALVATATAVVHHHLVGGSEADQRLDEVWRLGRLIQEAGREVTPEPFRAGLKGSLESGKRVDRINMVWRDWLKNPNS